MDLNKVCFGCFQEKEGNVCPYCGYSADQEQSFLALPPGLLLNGRYIVGKVLGIGGFGITYLGFDTTLEIKVAIKEYMPSGMATRDPDKVSVQLTGRLEEEYRAGESKFLDEARILAKLQNTANIVSVQNYFRENNTAYFVMEYVEGMSLKTYIAERGGRITYEEARYYLKPIMEALVKVHALKLLHRDISPDNIYITSDGQSRLLDFGAARFAAGDNKSVSVILKHGFAPEEQYSSHGNQGPWTDVYAMAATFYSAICGILPPDSVERLSEDRIQTPSQLGIAIPPMAEAALMKAMAVRVKDRFSNMTAFLNALEVSDAYSSSQYSQTVAADYNQYGQYSQTQGYTQPSGGYTNTSGQQSAYGNSNAYSQYSQYNPAQGYSQQPGQQYSQYDYSSGYSAQSPAQPKKKKTGILIGAIGGGAALMIAIVLIIALSSGSSNKKSAAASTTTAATTSSYLQEPSTAASQASNDKKAFSELDSAEAETTSDDETEETPAYSLMTREIPLINASVELPESFTADSTMTEFTDEANSRKFYADYIWYSGGPVYSYQDVKNDPAAFAGSVLEGLGVSDFDVAVSSEAFVNGKDAFAFRCDGVNSDGAPSCYYFAAIDSGEELGSYILLGVVEADDSEGAEIVLTAMDSFRILGSVPESSITVKAFKDPDMGIKVMFPKTLSEGGIEEDKAEEASDVTCIYIYPVSGNYTAFVEVDEALEGYGGVDDILTLLEDFTKEQEGGTVGTRSSFTSSGREWTYVDTTQVYSDITYVIYYAATEIDGKCYLVSGTCDQSQSDVEDKVLELMNEVIASLMPY